MTQQETVEMDLAHERALKWYDSLTLAGKIEHLQRIGILDRHQRLSKRYGGDGEEVQVEAHAFPVTPRPLSDASLQAA